MKTVVVIGAGFCGAVAAAQLLRTPSPVPLKVVLLNRSGLMARGVAYGTRTEQHVLNVPAGRMSAYADDADHFLRYARGALPGITGASFVPRRLYGDYLEWLLSEAARNPAPGHAFRAMVGEVARICPDDTGASIELASGETLRAERVVLALGNYAPATPGFEQGRDELVHSPRYVRDPWRPDALWGVRPDEPVLLIGTGLTMLDVVLDLRARGVRAPIHALSRRGLMPLPHRELELRPHYDLPPRFAHMTAGLRRYLRALRMWMREAAAQGVDWRDIIGGLRAHTPALWQAMHLKERQRFLRHLRPYWEVHRHRCAPALWAALAAEHREGHLQVHAGRLAGVESSLDALTVHYRPRGQTDLRRLRVGAVINCTGPEADTRTLREPLIAGLREAGLLQPDALGLGVEVDAAYRLIGAGGQPSAVLHYVGPFLKARDWEATAVPELRRHVAALCTALRASLA